MYRRNMSGKLKKVVMFIRIPYLWNNVLPYYLKTEDLSLKTLACHSKNIAELIRGFDPDRPHVTGA